MYRKPVSAALVFATLLLGATTAQAQGESEITGRLPLPYAQRPITLTANTLRVDGAFTLLTHPELDTAAGLALGAAYGVMDDLEVGATVLPLAISPDFDYGDPSVYGRFRLLRGELELGAEVVARIPVQSDDFALRLGVPVRFHLGDNMQLNTGVYVPLTFSDPVGKALEIPLAFAFNVNPNIFLGAMTGFHLIDFDFDFLAIPLGVFGGYTLAGNGGGPMADIMVGLTWPLFLTPNSDGDTVTADLMEIRVAANVYLDM